MPISTQSPKSPKKSPTTKIFLAVFAVVLIIFTAYFISLDLQSRTTFTKVSNESLRIEQVGIKPLENRFVKEIAKGDGLLSRIGCIPDVQCPTIQKTWYVVVEDGKENITLRNILQNAGYPMLGVCTAEDQTNCDSIVMSRAYCNINDQSVCDYFSEKGSFEIILSLDKQTASVENAGQKKWKKLVLNINTND